MVALEVIPSRALAVCLEGSILAECPAEVVGGHSTSALVVVQAEVAVVSVSRTQRTSSKSSSAPKPAAWVVAARRISSPNSPAVAVVVDQDEAHETDQRLVTRGDVTPRPRSQL